MTTLSQLLDIYKPTTIEFFGDSGELPPIEMVPSEPSTLAVSLNHCQHLSPEEADEHLDHLTEDFDVVLFSAGSPGSGKPYNGTDQLADYWLSQFQIRGFVPIDVGGESRLPLAFSSAGALERHSQLAEASARSDFSWRNKFRTGAGEVRAKDPAKRVGPDTKGQSRRIAASVVTFNPKPEQLERLRHLAAMFPAVVVADNSEPPAAPVHGVHWVPMHGNKGIAAALNAVCKQAKELGYEWLFTLDQDTDVEQEALDGYLAAFAAFDDKDGTAIIAPRTDGRDVRKPDEGDVRELEMVMTSGCLTNLAIWERIGGFADELFIDEVDHEYCLRARQNGYRVVRLLNAYLPHQPGRLMTIIARRGPTLVGWHPPKRLYYIVRNYFFMKRRYKEVFPEVISERRRLIIAKFKEYLLYHPNRHKAVPAMVLGAIHGFLGRFGK